MWAINTAAEAITEVLVTTLEALGRQIPDTTEGDEDTRMLSSSAAVSGKELCPGRATCASLHLERHPDTRSAGLEVLLADWLLFSHQSVPYPEFPLPPPEQAQHQSGHAGPFLFVSGNCNNSEGVLCLSFHLHALASGFQLNFTLTSRQVKS
ncbi:uncharacterized protein LOC142413581 isoform X2 [Mycteria americana]|uniref:uncharacterized protein LOC142413581 isoform X2 n=1 Tax=Mycteria americana TaxID=33587 RepID=UPI003F5835F0